MTKLVFYQLFKLGDVKKEESVGLDWIFLVSKHWWSDYQEIPTLWRRKKGKYYNIINRDRPAWPEPQTENNHSDLHKFIIHLNQNTEVQSHEGRGESRVIELNQSELLD